MTLPRDDRPPRKPLPWTRIDSPTATRVVECDAGELISQMVDLRVWEVTSSPSRTQTVVFNGVNYLTITRVAADA